ncbi:MAG: hypothetical protein LBI29_02875 [Rickettsiales bacterium]|nr:hypothetical protein [Rickettsiales bacterium]
MFSDFLLDVVIGSVYGLPPIFIVAKLATDFILVKHLYGFRNRTINCNLFFDALAVFDMCINSRLLYGLWGNLFYFPSEMFEGSIIASLIFFLFSLWLSTRFFTKNRYVKLFCWVPTVILTPSMILTLLIRTGKVTPILTELALSLVIDSWFLYASALAVHTILFSFHLFLKVVQRQRIERKR